MTGLVPLAACRSAAAPSRQRGLCVVPVSRGSRLFEDTVEALLDAAYDDARWGDAFIAMDRLCGLNGGQFTHMAYNAEGVLEATFGACYIRGDPHEEIVADWVENYADTCENVPRVGTLPTWRLTHNEELFTPAEKRTSLMYNEFQPKYDCQDQVAVVVDRPTDDRRRNDYLMWTMANGTRAWDGDKLERIRALLPHIRQAVRVRQELVAAEAHAYADVTALLDNAALGVVLLDRRGQVVAVNGPAQGMLRARAGLHEWRGELRARMAREDARFRRAVAAALPDPVGVPVGAALSIRRGTGLPLLVHVHPIDVQRMDFGAERLAVLVLIRDPDAHRVDADLVGDVLGLTPAESRVTVLLAMGRSVREIARQTGRTENTIRWTLKQALAKTDSTRQADLVRLVMQLPPRS